MFLGFTYNFESALNQSITDVVYLQGTVCRTSGQLVWNSTIW